MEHPWFPIDKNKKGLKEKKLCFISTSTASKEWDILAEVMSLMTSDLNFYIKDKFTDFINK